MQALDTIAALQALLHVENLGDELVILLGRFHLQLRRRFLDRPKRLHHKDGVMRHDRASAFIHDRRMLHAFAVANIHDVPDDVVRVFLQVVVGRRIEVAA